MPVKPIEAKSGLKTTEFWMTVATVVGSLVASVANVLPPKYAAIAAAASTAIYTIARAFTKANVQPE